MVNFFATTCYGRVSFFDGMSGKNKQKLEWKGSMVSMVLSPNSDIVVCGRKIIQIFGADPQNKIQ